MLHVRCDSTAWATQLRLMRTQIVTEIASRFPGAGIETIRFQGRTPPPGNGVPERFQGVVHAILTAEKAKRSLARVIA